jgi:transposase
MSGSEDTKTELLAKYGLLNPRSAAVRDELFERYEFFDARDLLQAKYEMVRRVQKDGWTVTQAAKTYGFSRPAYYEVQQELKKSGLPGLIPKRRGPKSPHKLSDEVMNFIEQALGKDQNLKASVLATMIADHFHLTVHPRSVERALAKEKKKRTFKDEGQKQ